ncbi:MAG: hypothetical protein GYA51_13700 [Candidatus Methanofastidiosa archaeon]|nr:hypothetical protein [Candidatus Methanofastidiosa archaeon]
MNKKDFENILLGFSEDSEPINAIQNYLSIIPKLSQGLCIREFVLFHKADLSEIILKTIEKYPSLKINSHSSPVFNIMYKVGEKREYENGIISLLPTSFNSISHIVTISTSYFWNNVVRKFVKRLYPYAMPVFFRQNEIENALKNLEGGLGSLYRIRIADVTAKEGRYHNNSNQQKKYDTQRWWIDLPILEVFNQAKERGQWFSGLRFIIQKRVEKSNRFVSISSGRIHKFGEISFDYFYPEVNKLLIHELENQANNRLQTFEGRGLRERNYLAASPIQITFDSEVFSDIEEIRRFGSVVKDYPNSTKVVFHSNPYYHASIADFLDGSSFEVWILSSSNIILIPQAKSSAQAFERLVGYIYSNFSEGIVKEYHE